MAEKRIILFIDDDPVDRLLIHELLAQHDFHVLLAEDGFAGLKMARTENPVLILLDILLPGISGIDICKKLKVDPATQNIPVIFYTSIDTPKDFIDYASWGAQDYIQKTMPPQELVAAIKAILK